MNLLYIYSSNINPTHGWVQRVTKVLCDYFRTLGHNCYYLSSQPTNGGIKNQYVLPNGKNGVDCYSKNGHAVTVLTRQS